MWGGQNTIKLLECTHGQWLYCNVVVHDIISGTLAMTRKEELQVEIEEQQVRGTVRSLEEDEYFLEINLEDLRASSWETQQY